MDFALSDDQKNFQALAREFLDKEVVPFRAEWDRIESVDTAIIPKLGEMGFFGLTIPALSIKGEIGQQLGYIVAGSAGAGDLFLLILIGWAYSHRRQTFHFFQWISRGRFRAPPEDEYST